MEYHGSGYSLLSTFSLPLPAVAATAVAIVTALLCISLLVQLLCKQSAGHQAAVRRSQPGMHRRRCPLQTIMAT